MILEVYIVTPQLDSFYDESKYVYAERMGDCQISFKLKQLVLLVSWSPIIPCTHV